MSTPNDNITISKADLAAMVAEAIAAERDKSEENDSNFEKMGQAVGAAMAKAQGPKKKSFGQYTREKNAGRSKLTREFWENGARVTEERLTNKEIDILNTFDHTGRYLDRLVQVIVREEGTEQVLEVRWPCKTNDQRNTLARNVQHTTGTTMFEDLLLQVQKVQDEERAEAEEKEEKHQVARRKFGSSKATQEAREKAGVV